LSFRFFLNIAALAFGVDPSAPPDVQESFSVMQAKVDTASGAEPAAKELGAEAKSLLLSLRAALKPTAADRERIRSELHALFDGADVDPDAASDASEPLAPKTG
jgi:hypothetical protein